MEQTLDGLTLNETARFELADAATESVPPTVAVDVGVSVNEIV